jgi:hypothetical protein
VDSRRICLQGLDNKSDPIPTHQCTPHALQTDLPLTSLLTNFAVIGEPFQQIGVPDGSMPVKVSRL